MISAQEFLIRTRVEYHVLEAWIADGWLVPPQTEPELMFSDIDLARAQLIRDLREDFGVNDEGISVILHLIDQMHGLRRSLQGLLEGMRGDASQADQRRGLCVFASSLRNKGWLGMLTVYGRKSSFNVQKVMWLVAELGLAHRHIEQGGPHAASIPRNSAR